MPCDLLDTGNNSDRSINHNICSNFQFHGRTPPSSIRATTPIRNLMLRGFTAAKGTGMRHACPPWLEHPSWGGVLTLLCYIGIITLTVTEAIVYAGLDRKSLPFPYKYIQTWGDTDPHPFHQSFWLCYFENMTPRMWVTLLALQNTNVYQRAHVNAQRCG